MNMRKYSMTLGLCGAMLAAVLAAPALADEGGSNIFTTAYMNAMKSLKMMDKMDANKDHMVSKEEWTSYHNKTFDMMDKNKDGMIDANEWKSLGGIGGKNSG